MKNYTYHQFVQFRILALANRHGAGGMADLNMGADAGTERNDNANQDQNIHGGNVGGVYQDGVAPAAAAAAAANNRLNNNANAENVAAAVEAEIENHARGLRSGLRRSGEEEGIRRTVGNWQSGMQQIKWLRRMYVQPVQSSRLHTLRCTVYEAGKREIKHYRREMSKKPIMISTSSPGSSSFSRNVTHVRGRRAVGRTRSSNALPSQSGSQANNRAATYRTRAVREREQQHIDDDDEDDHSATSVSSDSSDQSLAEDQLSSSSDSSDSQSSVYSDWVNPVCIAYQCTICSHFSSKCFFRFSRNKIAFYIIILGC